MEKKTFSMLIVAMILLSLCGCAPKITEGEIYEKEYREAFTTVQFFPLIVSNGKTSTTRLIPYVMNYPERYVIHIKAYKDEKWQTEDFYVSRDVYDSVKIGDMFCYDSERGDLDDEPYTKERKNDADS